MHLGNGSGHLIDRFDVLDIEFVGQVALVDDLNDSRVVFLEPYSAIGAAVYVHLTALKAGAIPS